MIFSTFSGKKNKNWDTNKEDGHYLPKIVIIMLPHSKVWDVCSKEEFVMSQTYIDQICYSLYIQNETLVEASLGYDFNI